MLVLLYVLLHCPKRKGVKFCFKIKLVSPQLQLRESQAVRPFQTQPAVEKPLLQILAADRVCAMFF